MKTRTPSSKCRPHLLDTAQHTNTHKAGLKSDTQRKKNTYRNPTARPLAYMFAPLSSSTAAALLESALQAACKGVHPLPDGSAQFTSPLWAMHHTILSTSPRAAAWLVNRKNKRSCWLAENSASTKFAQECRTKLF